MLVALSLGSNLGDRLALLTRARGSVAALPRTHLIAASSLYDTDPVDPPPGVIAPPFLNAVLLIDTALAPGELLRATQSIERDNQRARSQPNAPRTLDIDLIFCDDLTISTPDLTLPHPRAHLRRFVLAPLAELRPDLILPGQTRTVAQLLSQLPPHPAATRSLLQWETSAISNQQSAIS